MINQIKETLNKLKLIIKPTWFVNKSNSSDKEHNHDMPCDDAYMDYYEDTEMDCMKNDHDYAEAIFEYVDLLSDEPELITDKPKKIKQNKDTYPINLGDLPDNPELTSEDRKAELNCVAELIGRQVIESIDNTYELNYLLTEVRKNYNSYKRKEMSEERNWLIDEFMSIKTEAFLTIQLKNGGNKSAIEFNRRLIYKTKKLLGILNEQLYGKNWKEHMNNYLTGYVAFEKNCGSNELHAHICLGEHKAEPAFEARVVQAYNKKRKALRLPALLNEKGNRSTGCFIEPVYCEEGVAIYSTKELDESRGCINNYYILSEGSMSDTVIIE